MVRLDTIWKVLTSLPEYPVDLEGCGNEPASVEGAAESFDSPYCGGANLDLTWIASGNFQPFAERVLLYP